MEFNYTGLVDERDAWRHELKYDSWNEPYILQQYRENRGSDLWRTTREVEKLCEYILFLEKKSSDVHEASMNEEIKITLNNENLSTLLRLNLSCYVNKTLTLTNLDEITQQIIDSIDYFLNKKDENFDLVI